MLQCWNQAVLVLWFVIIGLNSSGCTPLVLARAGATPRWALQGSITLRHITFHSISLYHLTLHVSSTPLVLASSRGNTKVGCKRAHLGEVQHSTPIRLVLQTLSSLTLMLAAIHVF
jgi:hypothetical protein